MLSPRALIAVLLTTSFCLVALLSRSRIEPFINLVPMLYKFSSHPIPTLDPKTLTISSEDRQQVPKIIHQVKLGGSAFAMRSSWIEARQACIDLHPQWEFKLWDDETGNKFVLDEFGDELYAMYRGYPQEIMRSNVLRYLVLLRQGGVYLDLDLKCRVALDPFLAESFVTPPAQPSGANNAFVSALTMPFVSCDSSLKWWLVYKLKFLVLLKDTLTDSVAAPWNPCHRVKIVAKPNHPFLQLVVDKLPQYNLGWFGSPYATNMFSTGCYFFSTMHVLYKDRANDMKILPWEYRLNGHVTTPLFEHLGASSWHKGDAAFILSIGKAIETSKPYFRHFVFSLIFILGTLAIIIILHRRRHHYRRIALQASTSSPILAAMSSRSTSPISPVTLSPCPSARGSFENWFSRFNGTSIPLNEKYSSHMA